MASIAKAQYPGTQGKFSTIVISGTGMLDEVRTAVLNLVGTTLLTINLVRAH